LRSIGLNNLFNLGTGRILLLLITILIGALPRLSSASGWPPFDDRLLDAIGFALSGIARRRHSRQIIYRVKAANAKVALSRVSVQYP
jgi:hypothetical protein